MGLKLKKNSNLGIKEFKSEKAHLIGKLDLESKFRINLNKQIIILKYLNQIIS